MLRPDAPVVLPDLGHRLPGRGVSIHPRRACLESAVRRGGLSRGLRCKVTADAAHLGAEAIEQYRRRIDGLLATAMRTRGLIFGTDALRDALRRAEQLGGGKGMAGESVALVVMAGDAAGRRDELLSLAGRAAVPVVVFGSKETLGRLLRRGEVGVLGILDTALAAAVQTAAACMTSLSEEV